jgi:monofunctional biosynthetic peptidoglycan transglycosylase
LRFLITTVLFCIALFVVTSVAAVVLYRWVPVKATPLMFIRSLEHPTDAAYTDWKHRWVPYDSISPYMAVAVMASEDQNFRHHKGFDLKAIEQARREYEEGGRRRGASTISQQTAKNAFLWPRSSWVRKGLETYFTVLIEMLWSKERIMEVYLNSIEMGPGIYGVEAVAEEHFHTTAAALSRSRCALIAATLPNPIRFSSKQPSAYIVKRQHRIMQEMRHIDFLKEEKQ